MALAVSLCLQVKGDLKLTMFDPDESRIKILTNGTAVSVCVC